MNKNDLLRDHKSRWARIREAMDAAGIKSQVALAKRLNVSQPSISGWKNGDFLPEMRHIIKIGEISGMCVEWLLTGRGPRYPADAMSVDIQTLVAILDGMSESDRQEILDFARFRQDRDKGNGGDK